MRGESTDWLTVVVVHLEGLLQLVIGSFINGGGDDGVLPEQRTEQLPESGVFTDSFSDDVSGTGDGVIGR